jgi:hypothetical protein
MKSNGRFYWGLGLFFILAIAIWLGSLQVIAEWLWNIMHGMPRP